MAGNRSFKEYVKSRFYNELYLATEDFVEDNIDNLDLRLRNVHRVGEVSLADMEIKFVSINDLPGMKIGFDVVVEGEIEVSEGDYHYDEFNQCFQWFSLSCTGDLAHNLDDFKITFVSVYNQKDKIDNPLSDALVPYIRSENLDAIANDFLRKYYPEALKTPMAIDPKKLAEDMGLKVELKNITKDYSIFGQIYFHDSEAEFYDSNKEEWVKTLIKARTIIVDPEGYFLRNLGMVNNTIVHECVHWDKHRKAFELERLYNESATKISCKTTGGIKDDERDATGWMEWQANSLTPRIQMPLAMFKTKAFEFIKQYRREMDTDEMIDVMEPVIDALSQFFGVSRLAAKIRMIDAGYEEAIGTFTYIDGRYVKPHRFKKGALEKNQTFSISAQDAAIQAATNPAFISLTNDGSYQYVDAHFVLNHPKYITRDIFGHTALTDYARTHMEECCLVFDLSVRTGIETRYHTECFLNRDETSTIRFDTVYGKGYQYATPEKKKQLLAEELAENARIYNELPNGYTACLKMVREWKGVTYEELAERTLMNERTIRRIVNGEKQGSLNSLILICLGLHLPPEISYHIIEKSPYSLNYTNESHIFYNFVLKYKYADTMDEIRDFLQEIGAEPL
ncbi:helix-turn-helix domain-containing protein [Alkalihalobacillus oceani]|uniref:helix-turn-helix domain-containing protein n=1 Tax=Halalkalibacter oceani TaxID=1653776 RepID=UPI0020401ADD|nr:helix-turn-helix transcriptional regulator [Halalkalibacter oceani]MCM3761062.1 helix-turn-helix domain-containing protein [Halalkalibacter oceani]